MPWIESHSVIGRHRKFKGLARQLKIPLPQAVGHMHLLWHTAIEQAEDGDLSTWTVGAIADSACWEGSEQEFLNAVQENGLMDEQRIHDWLDHAGKYLTSKYKTSNPDRLHEIWAKFGKIYGKEAKGNSLELPKDPPHNITLPNLTKQKERLSPAKKREQKHAFEDSPFFDFQAFCSALPKWSEGKCKHWHQKAAGYSTANGGRYLNWAQAVTNWDREKPFTGATATGSSFLQKLG